jgi:hypothetical protein
LIGERSLLLNKVRSKYISEALQEQPNVLHGMVDGYGKMMTRDDPG